MGHRYCEIHQTNYRTEEGCPLWHEDSIQHLAENECLPAESHPMYREAVMLRKPDLQKKAKKKWKSDRQWEKTVKQAEAIDFRAYQEWKSIQAKQQPNKTAFQLAMEQATA